ncbi:heat shock 70 kDa protein 12A-like [Dreissena polymorpha]|uniref:Uncharacterized protein n=1 Tax=Dreissena polymorpha TaxID=45954 RepID=A0A9D4DGF3_DREPO|nr:heat shock 70 kDa protein 12A-like [Dreissena polymorpha]KAH3748381.1 hypothetical protein DPMN_182826 [Dreissena polymorpha]
MKITRKQNAASGNSIAVSDKLRIDHSDVQTWFSEPISSRIDQVKDLRKLDYLNDVNTVLLVDGFAESNYVQERLRDEIPGISLIVPEDAGLAVRKGAMIFEHNPDVVAARVMYGVAVNITFDEKKHPSEVKQLYTDEWCVFNRFKIYVNANEEISVDREVVRHFIAFAKETLIRVYRTKSDKPINTTEAGCERLVTFRINNTDSVSLSDQRIEVHFMFGRTELLIKVKRSLTGEEKHLP